MKYVVRLSAGEREHLQALIRKGKSPAKRLLKARILLGAHETVRSETRTDCPERHREPITSFSEALSMSKDDHDDSDDLEDLVRELELTKLKVAQLTRELEAGKRSKLMREAKKLQFDAAT